MGDLYVARRPSHPLLEVTLQGVWNKAGLEFLIHENALPASGKNNVGTHDVFDHGIGRPTAKTRNHFAPNDEATAGTPSIAQAILQRLHDFGEDPRALGKVVPRRQVVEELSLQSAPCPQKRGFRRAYLWRCGYRDFFVQEQMRKDCTQPMRLHDHVDIE